MSTSDVLLAVRFLWLLAAATDVLSQDSPVKMCLSDEDKNRTVNVTLSCPPGAVLSVGEAFFGRNQWGLCFYSVNDCIDNIDSFQFCNGERNCTRVFTGIYTKKCGYSTFFTVIYDCIGGSILTPPVVVDPGHDPTAYNGAPTPTPAVPKHVLRVPSWDPVVTPKSNDDTALIAGCAVAVIITVTVLIFAIILVVRRLVGIRQDGSQSPKKRSGISVLICTKLGCAMASCRDPDPEEGGNGEPAQPEGDDEEDEGRVTPLGADAVEEVHELGRPDVTSEDQHATATTSGTDDLHSQSNQRSSSFEADQQQSLENTSSSSQISTGNGRQGRLDAVAVPNTELSTLC